MEVHMHELFVAADFLVRLKTYFILGRRCKFLCSIFFIRY